MPITAALTHLRNTALKSQRALGCGIGGVGCAVGVALIAKPRSVGVAPLQRLLVRGGAEEGGELAARVLEGRAAAEKCGCLLRDVRDGVGDVIDDERRRGAALLHCLLQR